MEFSCLGLWIWRVMGQIIELGVDAEPGESDAMKMLDFKLELGCLERGRQSRFGRVLFYFLYFYLFY